MNEEESRAIYESQEPPQQKLMDADKFEALSHDKQVKALKQAGWTYDAKKLNKLIAALKIPTREIDLIKNCLRVDVDLLRFTKNRLNVYEEYTASDVKLSNKFGLSSKVNKIKVKQRKEIAKLEGHIKKLQKLRIEKRAVLFEINREYSVHLAECISKIDKSFDTYQLEVKFQQDLADRESTEKYNAKHNK